MERGDKVESPTIISEVDHKKEVKYWIEALNNKNITSKNKDLINRVLELELTSYIVPPFSLTIPVKIDSYENDKQEALASFYHIINCYMKDQSKNDKRVQSHIDAVLGYLNIS